MVKKERIEPSLPKKKEIQEQIRKGVPASAAWSYRLESTFGRADKCKCKMYRAPHILGTFYVLSLSP